MYINIHKCTHMRGVFIYMYIIMVYLYVRMCVCTELSLIEYTSHLVANSVDFVLTCQAKSRVLVPSSTIRWMFVNVHEAISMG